MKQQYFFGQELTKRIDFFAFPRCGSHFFSYLFAGLYDLIQFAHAELNNPEAIDRQRELNEQVLYALELREDGARYHPIYLNATATGMHGRPIATGYPAIILIREPIAAAYSYYRVAPRWGISIDDPRAWLQHHLDEYVGFYSAALKMIHEKSDMVLWITYENLIAGSDTIQRLVDFVGIRPKLKPEFVCWLTEFSRFTKPTERSFYRSGNNKAWSEDVEWRGLLRRLDKDIDFTPFGYGTLRSLLAEHER